MLLLAAAPAMAQETQPSAQTAPAGAPPQPAFLAYLPSLPPSVVPPRLEAPYPCRFPHSVVYEHPTGPVVLTFTVTAEGHVANIAVAQTSGSDTVDEGARACIANWVYAPALRDGAPVDEPWATQYNFTLTTSHLPLTRPPEGTPGKNFVMMPVRKFSLGDSATGCDAWHKDAAHGVLVAFDVEPDGTVKNASVAQTSGDAAEDKDALACVSRRTYKPATRSGEPVEIRLTASLYGG